MSAIDDIAVLTSENVRLTYTLAGMGSRVAAFLADSLIIGLVGIALTILFVFFGLELAMLTGSSAEGISLISALYIITMFLLIWGYYFFFEWINWGQTPGKLLLGIRVAAADGAPADMVACAMRNVVRLIDLLLAGLGVTFFIMIFTPRYQRLGDLAAGTVVVKRRRLSFDSVMWAARESDRATTSTINATATTSYRVESTDAAQFRIRLDDSERLLIERFIERRNSLPEHVRSKLANDLAGRIRAKVPGDVFGTMADEQVIVAALKANPRVNG